MARLTTVAKYRKIQERFKELSDLRVGPHDMRLNYDDILDQLVKEFYMARWTIQNVLRKDLDEEFPDVDENQLELFS